MPTLARSISSDRRAIPEPDFTLDNLVEDIRAAVETGGPAAVKEALQNAVRRHSGFLPEAYLEPRSEHYVRRNVYCDPDHQFSILAMVWGPGQSTPLHDHGGLWVVECVYKGLMTVRNYEYAGFRDGLHQFHAGEEQTDGPGVADYRVPPHEHHVLTNEGAHSAVTIHVFGGILDECRTYHPEPGGYREVTRTLRLDA